MAVAGAACGAAAVSSASPYLINTWQTEDGLPNSYVTDLAQTPDGYLWLGTYNGLARFDGARFVNFDVDNTPALKQAIIDNLWTDAQGTLWIVMREGHLASYRQGVFQFEWQPAPEDGAPARLVAARSNEVTMLLLSGALLRGVTTTSNGARQWRVLRSADGERVNQCAASGDGTIFCRMGDGHLRKLEGERFERLPVAAGAAAQRCNHLLADAAGRVWAGTEKEIAVWDAMRFRTMTPTNGEPELNVTRMLATGADSLWVTANGRTRRCRERQWLAEAGARPSLTGGAVESFYGDRDGGMWTHADGGLARVQPDCRVQTIATEHGLPNERVAIWFEDREGNAWAGLNRGGLVRLRPRLFQVLGPAEGLSDSVVMSVCEDGEGAMWLATYGGGVHRWRDGVFTRFNAGVDRLPGAVVSLCPDTLGRIWIGTGVNGALVHDGGEIKRLFPAAAIRNTAHAIFSDRHGRVWLGNQHGLYVWANDALRRFGPTDGFTSAGVRAFAEDAGGRVWMGAADGTVWRFADERFTAFRAGDALGRRPVWSLLADADGTVWAGTFRGGLLRMKDGQFSRCTTLEGLAHNVICQVLDDGRGQLWLGSHGGILRVAKTELHALAGGRTNFVSCIAYGKHDGLPTVECSGNYQPAGWRSRDGRLWFATVKGVVSVQPEEMSVNQQPPPVVIEEVRIDGVARPVRRASADASQPAGESTKLHSGDAATLEIGPGRHHVEFLYTGLSFNAPDKVRFQYWLEGLDEQWIDNGGRRTASYAYLRPGRYAFRVRACNNDGVWNETGAALVLTIVPFFWQTKWFLAASVLALFLGVGGSVRFVEKRRQWSKLARLEQAHAIERERARIAQDLHDDLGTSLTEISLLGALARRPAAAAGETRAHLAEITDKAQAMVGVLDEIVWAVNPGNDSVASVASYFCLFAERFLQSASLRCRLDATHDLPDRTLNSEQRHHLFLAFKEALHNAVRHAGASEVCVSIAAAGGALVVQVEDNGRGLSGGTVAEGADGLRNMLARLEQLGGRCVIQGEAGLGTRVRLELPLG